MPHIIVEYSARIEEKVAIEPLLERLHAALAGQGVDKARIKTRGIRLDRAIVGEKGAGGVMAHATILLLEGRDAQTKKNYGQALHSILKFAITSHFPECAVTLEVRDMEKETYVL